MKRIIIHWTVGKYTPNQGEKNVYHYLVGYQRIVRKDKSGKDVVIENAPIYAGTYKPEDNLNCNDGRYAAHTGGGNTGSIGVALCAMWGYKDIKNVGSYPITQKQAEACFKLCADLCKKYKLPINKNTVITHYEFGKAHPNTSSRGKIDIITLPYEPTLKADDIGDYIRRKAKWYFNK